MPDITDKPKRHWFKRHEKEIKKEKVLFSFRFKRWFFGLGKEFSRITWMHYTDVIKTFITIVIIVAIICVIFLGIDSIYFMFKPQK